MSMHKNISSRNDMKQYITFSLDNEKYGLDVMEVESIERLSNITRVPKSENYVLGVINLRGDIIPIINIRNRMDLPARSYDEQTRIIVVKVRDYQLGIIVDNVLEVLNVSEDDIQGRNEIFEERKDEWISGIIRLKSEVVLILDLNKLLDIESKNEVRK